VVVLELQILAVAVEVHRQVAQTAAAVAQES
jgi:hypothetical protein